METGWGRGMEDLGRKWGTTMVGEERGGTKVNISGKNKRGGPEVHPMNRARKRTQWFRERKEASSIERLVEGFFLKWMGTRLILKWDNM